MERVQTPPNPEIHANSAFSTRHPLPATLLSFLLATLFALSGLRRAVVARNLELVPVAKPRFFRWKLGFNLARDLFALLSIGPRRPARPYLSPRSLANLKALRGGPSILLATHFHNWEAQASALAGLGVPLLGAGRPLSTKWADRLLRAVRARRGIPVVTRDVPRRALRHLGSGGCFGFLWDQHAPAPDDRGLFFGHPVHLNPLPLALLERHPVPVFFGVWLPGGELRILPLHLGKPGAPGPDGQRLQRRYHRVLETLIRRHPTYWYGFLHARFKNLGPYPGHRGGIVGP